MKHRSRTNFELCYLCNAQMPKFSTTPILELPDETWEPCCEQCADEKFPGWDDENEDDDELTQVDPN